MITSRILRLNNRGVNLCSGLHLRAIELENSVNKVISLHMYTQIQVSRFKVCLCLSLSYIFCIPLFLCKFQICYFIKQYIFISIPY